MLYCEVVSTFCQQVNRFLICFSIRYRQRGNKKGISNHIHQMRQSIIKVFESFVGDSLPPRKLCKFIKMHEFHLCKQSTEINKSEIERVVLYLSLFKVNLNFDLKWSTNRTNYWRGCRVSIYTGARIKCQCAYICKTHFICMDSCGDEQKASNAYRLHTHHITCLIIKGSIYFWMANKKSH